MNYLCKTTKKIKYFKTSQGFLFGYSTCKKHSRARHCVLSNLCFFHRLNDQIAHTCMQTYTHRHTCTLILLLSFLLILIIIWLLYFNILTVIVIIIVIVTAIVSAIYVYIHISIHKCLYTSVYICNCVRWSMYILYSHKFQAYPFFIL